MKVRQYFALKKMLNKRMVEISEIMNLDKATDVYSECVCKMNGWTINIAGGYSMMFVEIGLAFMHGYIKALHDNGFCFKKGLVKPIDPERDIPCGGLEHYDDKIHKEDYKNAVEALRRVMSRYESSKTNIATIVSAFEKEIGNENTVQDK